MKRHILYVSGEDHHLRIPFILALKERGFRITAASSGDPAPFREAGIEHHAFKLDRFINPVADLATLKALSRIFSDVRPDLIQSFDTKPNFLAPLAAHAVPDALAVQTVNGLGWLYSSSSVAALAMRPFYVALHRLAGRRVAATIFQNTEDKAFFDRDRTRGSRRNLLIRGSGVDIQGFDRQRAAGSSARLRDSLGLGNSEVIITVARMTRQKGIPTLLAAAALVHRVKPDARFLLVGPRDSEGRMAIPEAQIRQHAPYTVSIGQRSDIPALLDLADVFAFPTEYREGVPRALLEAALAELPIVTTQMPGCSDVIRDGWSGFLVPTRAPQILAERILKLLQNRQAARQMARRAAEYVRREFGLETIVARYAELYGELLDGSRVSRTTERLEYGAAMTAIGD